LTQRGWTPLGLATQNILRSASRGELVVPFAFTSATQCCVFSVVGPSILPSDLRVLHITKTQFVRFCSHKSIPEMISVIQIDNIPMPQTKSVKFLGVIVDQNPTWSEHITQITNKVSKNIGILSRISYKLPAHTLISLYYSLIYPYLAYCNMIWSSNYVTRISHLVTLHKKAIRIITKSSHNSRTSHMFRKHSILKIDQIKIYQTGQ